MKMPSAGAALSWPAAGAYLSTAYVDAVRDALTALDPAAWPTHARLNELAQLRGIRNARGAQIRFVPADANALHYETRIATHGEVATRDNWHDLFNALQWLTFPRSKAAISELHGQSLAAGGEMEARDRSVQRDVLTLFDENGLIVVSTRPELLALVRGFRWRELFVDHREEVKNSMRWFLAGHGVLEKSLDPYVGLTAKALLFVVDEDFLAADRAAQVGRADALAARWIVQPEHLSSPRNLHPLPLLGIPGWDERNESPAFYDDVHYFRPGYTRSA